MRHSQPITNEVSGMTEVTASNVSQASSANKIYLRETIFYYRGLLVNITSPTLLENAEFNIASN